MRRANMKLIRIFLLSLVLTLSGAVGVVVFSTGTMAAVAVDKGALEDPVLEASAREIMKEIRCLVCQNQSIEDSGAGLAQDLRQIVRERVVAGDDAEAVKAYLVDRYGDWVLLRPPFKARTAILWLAPAIFLITGLAGFVLVVRRRNAAAAGAGPAEALSAEDEARLAHLEKDHDL